MPRKDEHLDQAKHNESFANEVATALSTYADWAIVAAFYSAIHYLEARFAFLGFHSDRHETRDRYVHTHCRNLWKPYRQLKDDATEARYNCQRYTVEEFRRDCLPALDRIRTDVLRLLRP